mmetsp:Transcript_8065/g.24036  ORF Transcript_8065/g.24036 Transcript_8065/m.24036 type:complete len:110 (+) Transcript_8065:726-1055(+)
MVSMHHALSIKPFDYQDARPYRDNHEIVPMTNLVQAFQVEAVPKVSQASAAVQHHGGIVSGAKARGQAPHHTTPHRQRPNGSRAAHCRALRSRTIMRRRAGKASWNVRG